MLSILVADDEKATRDFVRFIIRKYDLPLEFAGEASDGAEALQLAKLLQPDIACIDIRMPVLDGLGAIEKIRGVSPDTIHIILTAYDEFELAQRALRLGAFDYLVKPIRPEELVRALRAGIERIETRNSQGEEVSICHGEIDTDPLLFHDVVTVEGRLYQDVRLGDREGARRSLKDLIGVLLERSEPGSIRQLTSELRELAGILIHAAVQGGASPGELRAIQAECLKELLSAKEVTEAGETFGTFLDRLVMKVLDAQRGHIAGRIDRAKEFIHRNYQSVNLKDIAKIMCTTPSYASRLFQEEVGLSFKEYVKRVRVKEAKKLFSTTELSVAQIAERVGYEDAGYFSRIFKEITGKLPREFKDQSGTAKMS